MDSTDFCSFCSFSSERYPAYPTNQQLTTMVKIEQIYTGCVAEAAYFIESNGEAAVIDPLRETQPYTERAEASKSKIKYIFETHFHADFVSGHVDLQKKTGAEIVYGPLAEPKFQATIATDGQVFTLGGCKIHVLHTPGHTMESVCYLLYDEENKPKCIFTGDTLFIGDVGRPDLAQKGAELTQEDLAAHLFKSLREKVMPLGDDLIVYPAHGAGSACGKNLSSETFDTLGNQKKTNYALRANMTVEEFTKELITGLAAPPSYFPVAVKKNKAADNVSYDTILENARKPVTVDDVEKAIHSDHRVVVIDTRSADEYVDDHIKGSIFCGLDDGAFGPWIAAAVGAEVDCPYIILPSKLERIDEITTRLSRFGFDNPVGHLPGGFEAWKQAGKPTKPFSEVDADELHKLMEADKDLYVVDVRKPGEHKANRHERSVNIPLDASAIAKVDSSRPVYIHCRSGYRSVIFASLLQATRPKDNIHIINIKGGFEAMESHPEMKKNIDMSPCQRAAVKSG